MNAKQKEFLLLRADGISFDKIAKKIQISKPTLIQWSKLFAKEINDIQFESLIAIKEEYSFSKKMKYRQLLQHLNKIDEGINNADLSETSIKDLMHVRNDITIQLEIIEDKAQFINTGLISDGIFGEEPLYLKLDEV